MATNDPYAALRIKEFNIFLLLRFFLVFGWSMQFIVIEWEVYSLTKDPLSLGIIGLMEIIPAFTMALFAGHIVDQNEKRNLLAIIISAFSLISLGLFLLTLPALVSEWETKTILFCIYGLVFFGGFLKFGGLRGQKRGRAAFDSGAAANRNKKLMVKRRKIQLFFS